MRITPALAVIAAGLSTPSNAQTERELESHEHGAALLNIAIDDSQVFLELESPWNNLVGFEYAPRTGEERALVFDAMELLEQPGQLFSFNGGKCTVTETVIESELGDHDEDDHHDHDSDDEDGHHDEDHDDHKDEDGHHDDHKDEDGHHDDHEGEGEHASLMASYTFDCSDLAGLSTIDVTLINLWSGFERLEVQLVGPGGQALEQLSQQRTGIDLTPVQ